MGRECDWLTKRKTNIQFCVDRGHRSQTHWHFLFIDEWSNREPDIKSPMGYLLTKSRFIIWCVIWTTTMMMAPYQWEWLHSSANITTSSNTLWPTNTTYASYCSFNAIWMGNQRRRVTGSQPQNTFATRNTTNCGNCGFYYTSFLLLRNQPISTAPPPKTENHPLPFHFTAPHMMHDDFFR